MWNISVQRSKLKKCFVSFISSKRPTTNLVQKQKCVIIVFWKHYRTWCGFLSPFFGPLIYLTINRNKIIVSIVHHGNLLKLRTTANIQQRQNMPVVSTFICNFTYTRFVWWCVSCPWFPHMKHSSFGIDVIDLLFLSFIPTLIWNLHELWYCYDLCDLRTFR